MNGEAVVREVATISERVKSITQDVENAESNDGKSHHPATE